MFFKTILFLLITVLFGSAFSDAEITFDSPIRVESSLSSKECWQYWKYDTQKQDFDGPILPEGYVLFPGIGYRMKYSKTALKDIDVVLIKGEQKNNTSNFEATSASRKKFNAQRIKDFFASISTITAAFLENGELYLVGVKKNPGDSPIFLLPEDMIVALRAVSNTPFRGALSVIDITGESSITSKKGEIRFEGMIENSHLGQVLFESDRVLKSISLGCDNITKKAVDIKAEWFKTKFDFKKMPKGEIQNEEWHQFWFGVWNTDFLMDPTAEILRLDDEKIWVKTKKLKNASETYFDPSAKSETGQFCENFTNNFPKFRNKFPVLNELVEISKLVAIAKWMFEKGILFKFDKEEIEPFFNRYTPLHTPIIKVTKTRTYRRVDLREDEEIVFEMSSVGGVDLENYSFKKKGLKDIKEKIKNNPNYIVIKLFEL